MNQSQIEEISDPYLCHIGSFQGREEKSLVNQPRLASILAATACPTSTEGVGLEAY